MRTYNEIERPDFTPEQISELKADEVAEMAKLYGTTLRQQLLDGR